MTGSAFTLVTPPRGQAYSCEGCGKCCRGYFAIAATAAEAERIRAMGWDDDPAMAGVPLFTGSGDRQFIAHRDDGACVFLDNDNLCRIHKRFGEAAKLVACRLYPFILAPVGSQARVDIRFDCPAVAANRGAALPRHLADLRALLPRVLPDEAAHLPAPPLFGRVAVGWPALLRITEAVRRLLEAPKLDLTRRIAAVVNLAAALRTPRLAELEGGKLDELLQSAAAKLLAAAQEDPLARVPPGGVTLLMFRQVLGVYGRADRIGERADVSGRFRHAWRMLWGRGTVPPLQADFPAVPFAALEGLFGTPDGEAAAALARYYHVKLAALGFCGVPFYGRSYLDGLNGLLLTYPLLLWFARLFAAGRNRPALDAEAVHRALEVLNHQYGITPILDLPTERYRHAQLTERSTLRSLVVWYGS
jgi:lysine-N-methylase